jgi:hypothetical protein
MVLGLAVRGFELVTTSDENTPIVEGGFHHGVKERVNW